MKDWQVELRAIFDADLPDPHPFRPVSPRGVIIYGAGDMGKMALDLMRKKGLAPLYFIDAKKTGNLEGIPIYPMGAVPIADKQHCTFIIAIASLPFQPIAAQLRAAGFEDVRHFYDYSEIALKDVMPNGWATFALSRDAEQRVAHILHHLNHDPISASHYLQFLWWRLRRREEKFPDAPIVSEEKYFFVPFFPPLTPSEVYLDGGSHKGTSIQKFMTLSNGAFKQILAFEPDPDNMAVIKQAFDDRRIVFFQQALVERAKEVCFDKNLNYASRVVPTSSYQVQGVAIDDLGANPTIIKLHIEGSELSALHGARQTIAKMRPLLIVLADHGPDGLFAIPEYILEQGYTKVYFRLHDYCGNSAVFYAITTNKERKA